VKRWLERYVPDREKIREHKHLRHFGKLLHDPSLWHLNRRSTAGAFAVGLFVMYLPPLGQMFIAAAAAILFRVNLPISVALVWLSNPLTFAPMYYLAYRVGSWILSVPDHAPNIEYFLEWHHWLDLLAPMTVGSLVCGAVFSALGYVGVQLVWRWSLMRQIRLRRERYRIAASAVRTPSSKRQT
jgi:hypothetical protein